MSDRQTRAQHGIEAAVEMEQRLILKLRQSPKNPGAKASARPGCAQPFAFEIEKGDLSQRIERSEARVELQTIDDLKRLAEPHMFGA